MLNNIKIQNYRNLKSLSIEKLGRVNLIIGKNNTGKTSLLEGLQILLSNGYGKIISDILKSRQESGFDAKTTINKIDEISSLFYGRKLTFSEKEKINIVAQSDTNNFAHQFSIRLVKYNNELFSNDKKEVPEDFKHLIPLSYWKKTEVVNEITDYKIGLELIINNKKNIKSFEDVRVIDYVVDSFFEDYDQANPCNFVSASNANDNKVLGRWWSNVALTENENYVINALKIVEPKIERISQIKEQQIDSFRFMIKLRELSKPISLRSMGDGINRILTIILAMVNCDSGYLLIDEFENGLHYSVQEKLWEIIFYLAERLNIQVFATTHSSDTIRAF